MKTIKAFLKRHSLWVGFAGVLVPLLILLAMQLVWLARLQRVSAIAHRATLNNFVEAIATETQYLYRSTAERALRVEAAVFTEGRLDRVAQEWAKKPVEGARRLFLVDFTRDPYGTFLVFDPERRTFLRPPASEESVAMIIAAQPWQMQSLRGTRSESPALNVDERNPALRFVLSPIVDEGSRVVGVVGMILDEDYFRTILLPQIIARTLPRHFPDARPGEFEVSVLDPRGKRVLGAPSPAQEETASARLPFVFTDWTLVLHGRRDTPEVWARAGFLFNVSLSALLAVALLTGILLALRAANRAMVLSEMKSDFVSNVSHELRTPLASIRVFAELLRLGRARTPEKVQEYGDYIEAESRRLSRLIDNILDFSRIESGRKTYTFVSADLREVVASTLSSFEVHLKHQDARIELEVPNEPLPPVAMDPEAIGLALHNLLDNAVKYSRGRPEIRVRLAREAEHLTLAVRDHGIGIARNEQARIFERFHRVGTGLVHEVKGSGLGLSIVRHIVLVHRGFVSVESEPGEGSTFTIHLPLQAGVPADRAPAELPRDAGRGPVA